MLDKTSLGKDAYRLRIMPGETWRCFFRALPLPSILWFVYLVSASWLPDESEGDDEEEEEEEDEELLKDDDEPGRLLYAPGSGVSTGTMPISQH